uniref:Uncharacterized protein n=1 Tax=Panagrolaimus sp. JU765 TaxID=591449 RepID=A0AC34Q5E0_9BILA
MLSQLAFIVLSLQLINADICPFENHTVCNEDIDSAHSCVCAMAHPESPAPERSCNKLIDIENNEFPAVSVTFKLDETAKMYDQFPEAKFKEEIGSSLKEDEENIIILRQGCTEENDQLIVQFVVRNKESSEASIPYKPDDFISPEIIVNKMKVIGFLSQIADLDVDETEVTDTLISIEGDVDNTLLLLQTATVVAVVVLTCVLGVWMALRKSDEPEYSPDLQKL